MHPIVLFLSFTLKIWFRLCVKEFERISTATTAIVVDVLGALGCSVPQNYHKWLQNDMCPAGHFLSSPCAQNTTQVFFCRYMI